jgi:hypothetical protein
VTTVRVTGVEDFAALGVRWRDLEQRANGSFFQSWTWVGCLARERFPDPVLVEATRDGRTVALALFNRVRRWIGPSVLHLGENGSAALDCPYVEQNGVLAEAGDHDELTRMCLRAVSSQYDLSLSGVDESVVAAMRQTAGQVVVVRSQASPFVDLAALRATGTDYLSGRSANTRQQIRRSDRFYEKDGLFHAGRTGVPPPSRLDRARSARQLRSAILPPVSPRLDRRRDAAWRDRPAENIKQGGYDWGSIQFFVRRPVLGLSERVRLPGADGARETRPDVSCPSD